MEKDNGEIYLIEEWRKIMATIAELIGKTKIMPKISRLMDKKRETKINH